MTVTTAAAEKAIAAAWAVTDRSRSSPAARNIAKDAPRSTTLPALTASRWARTRQPLRRRSAGLPSQHFTFRTRPTFGAAEAGGGGVAAWNELLSRYRQAHPDLAAGFRRDARRTRPRRPG